MNVRKRKVLLSGEEDFVAAFSHMWAEDNMMRMEDLGVFTVNLCNEAEVLTALCVHLLDIPLREYRELAKRVPETTPQSDAYFDLLRELDGDRDDEDSILAPLLHTAIINKVITAYNKTVA